MVMTPADVRDTIVATLAAKFPAWTVEAHGGQFTDRDLPLLLAKAPALLVSVLGLPSFQPKGPSRWSGQLQLAVYVFGPDGVVDRATLALDVTFALLALLPGQRWGLNEARPPDAESLRADNLYTGHANNLRVSLWAVSWTQTFTLEPSP